MLVVSYDWMLVVASVLVAILAAFTGFRVTSGLAALSPAQRKPHVAKAAVALGGGIWSMHFIGMIAVRISVAIEYDALATLGSALIAILITGFGLGLLHFGERTKQRIVLAGVAMGLGIVSMHYMGMSAIRGNCVVSYNFTGIVLSAAVGILSSIAALWLAYKKRLLRDLALGAVAFGVAISAMHYTAMVYTRFDPAVDVVIVPDPLLSSGILALIVAVSSFLICGFFLLTAIPVTPMGSQVVQGNEAEEGEQNGPSIVTMDSIPDPGALTRLPYETTNMTRFIALTDVFAIKADGHYTRLYDQSGDHFCPWSISSIEEKLEDPNFLRTHRSYLVNIAHVTGLQRIGDKATCQLGDDASSRIPVSRTRVHDVRKALGFD